MRDILLVVSVDGVCWYVCGDCCLVDVGCLVVECVVVGDGRWVMSCLMMAVVCWVIYEVLCAI